MGPVQDETREGVPIWNVDGVRYPQIRWYPHENSETVFVNRDDARRWTDIHASLQQAVSQYLCEAEELVGRMASRAPARERLTQILENCDTFLDGPLAHDVPPMSTYTAVAPAASGNGG